MNGRHPCLLTTHHVAWPSWRRARWRVASGYANQPTRMAFNRSETHHLPPPLRNGRNSLLMNAVTLFFAKYRETKN